MQTSELIGRLEQATGADRWLDADIHEAVTGFNCRRAGPGWPDEDEYVVPSFPGWSVLPAYSASIDAALTLVPANALWGIKALWENGPDSTQGPKAYRGSLDVYEVRDGLFWKDNYLSLAPAPALAICIAALRARNEGEG